MTEADEVSSDLLCAYCGERTCAVVMQFPERRAVRCVECKLVRTLPRPSLNYRDDESYGLAYVGPDRARLWARFSDQFITFIARYAPGKHLLEVGSGMGYLLEEAVRGGFAVQGLEVNRREVQMMRARGLDVWEGTLESLHVAPASFDVVCMSHVLEHIEDLTSLLREVHRVLKPRGILAVSQPHYASPLPHMLGSRWYGWQPGQHVWHFDVPALTHLLAENGFDRLGVQYVSLYYPWLPKPFAWNPKLIAGYLGTALAARIETWFGRGDQFFLAARRT